MAGLPSFRFRPRRAAPRPTAQERRDRRVVVAFGAAVVLAAALVSYGADRSGPVLGAVEQLEGMLLDASFGVRGPLTPSGQVAAVAIDQASIERFGRFPFERSVPARAVDALSRAGAGAVLMDVVFAEPTSEPEDAALVRAIAESRAPVVAGYFLYTDARGAREGVGRGSLDSFVASSPALARRSILRATGVQPPLPAVEGAAAGAGFLNLRVEPGDPVVRRAQLLLDEGGRLHPSAALVAATLQVLGPDGQGSPLFLGGTASSPSLAHASGNLPLDPRGGAVLNYVGPSSAFPTIGLAELLDRAEAGELDRVRPLVQGRAVVLGPSAVGIWDRRDTPFEVAGPAYAVHATTIDNLLEGRFLARPPWLRVGEWVLLLAFGLLTALVVARAAAPVAGAATVALAVGLLAFSPIALGLGLWFQPLHAVAGVLGAAAVGTTVRLTREVGRRREAEARRAEVARMFGRYVPPALVQRLLDDPDAARLGGERRRVSVLFSDLRDFTSLSEGLEPAALAGLLSAYLDRMSREVIRHEGVVDKFLGDGIMALFGAPVDDAAHPRHACEAALAKIEALERFNEDQLAAGVIDRHLEIGIGVNTGWAAVGNLGSELRFDYTAIGDEVNLAARLEGLTKKYGVRCILGEATAAELGGGFVLRELDLVRVKGREQPVRVFELVGRGERPPWIERYEEALAAYRDQDWDHAREACLDVLVERPQDGPSRVLLERCETRRAEPRRVGWDTVHAFDVK